MRDYLDEIARDGLPTKLIGFTGGEPFMNPDIIAMLNDVLSRGFDALVLTNAMKPMRRLRPQLLALREPWRAAADSRLARSLRTRSARSGARIAQLGTDDRRPDMAGAQRICHRCGRPAVLG